MRIKIVLIDILVSLPLFVIALHGYEDSYLRWAVFVVAVIAHAFLHYYDGRTRGNYYGR